MTANEATFKSSFDITTLENIDSLFDGVMMNLTLPKGEPA